MNNRTNKNGSLALALVLGLLLAFFASPALAQMGPGMMGGGHGYGSGSGQGYGPGYGMGPQGWGQPYTAEQQTAYWNIARKYSQQQSELNSKLWPLQADLNAALASDKPDAAKAREIADQLGDLMGEMYKLRMAFSIDLREAGLPVYNMMGPGMGSGMMGYGGGYGMMGPGMMGPGMMGGWQ
ncbi:periplasmic heavy metal sensor [Paucidesulfovibrio longus]|uniref:periplasmic heavy metal sensor n=1 Tax=Paucidesulfovibrio longus TaxID=889 RepID=UPI0003B5F9E2|nr:periplasmic heavy metal sensor [Paucidesulfovibrio longus]